MSDPKGNPPSEPVETLGYATRGSNSSLERRVALIEIRWLLRPSLILLVLAFPWSFVIEFTTWSSIAGRQKDLLRDSTIDMIELLPVLASLVCAFWECTPSRQRVRARRESVISGLVAVVAAVTIGLAVVSWYLKVWLDQKGTWG